KTVTITIVNDSIKEDDEQFTIGLSDPVNCSIVSPSSVTVTIVDDDGVRIVPHRNGLNFGQPLDRTTQQLGDPTKFFILVNDDVEGNVQNGTPDNTNPTAAVPGVSGTAVDDDLVKVVLKKVPSSWTSGSLEIVLSNPSSVRLFKSDGTPLANTTLSLSSP